MAGKGNDELFMDTPTIQLNELISSSTNLEHRLCEFILSGRHEITILLSGKTGTGKSHLTNALIGEELAEEGEELDPQTDDVTPYDFTKNNVKITVFDTPGLADSTGNDERYLRQILEKVNTVDLFLFCTDMTSRRFSDEDARTIRKLTKTFGPSLWDHALVVLTFANQVDLDDVHLDQQRISLFQNLIRRFQEKIQNFLLSEGVHQKAASNLPFVPAGKVTKPTLPDRENWLTTLWIAAFKRINRNAKADFLLASFDRLSISCGALLSEYPVETDRTRREDGEEDGIDNFWTEGTLKRSSPVISASEEKDFRELLKTIKSKQLTLTPGESNNNAILCDHHDVNETKRGSLKRSSVSVSKDGRDQFRARMRTKSLQGFRDEKDSEKKSANTSKCVDTGKNCAEADWHGDHGDDVMTRFNRLSVSELETEQHVYSLHECLIQYSLPPAYDEVVRNQVPLPMDESSSQELFKEMVREAISSQQTGEFVGALAGQSGFGRIYAAFFAKIVEFVKKPLRGTKTTEAKMHEWRQKEHAHKF